MARRTTIKMGSLNLLLLVIAICLAVLSVLSFVTARAEYNLTQKQSLYVQDTYAEEMAAQHFVSLIDADLETAREGKTNVYMAITNAGASLSRYMNECTQLEDVQAYGITGEAKLLSVETLTGDLRLFENSDLEKVGESYVIDSGEEYVEEAVGETSFYSALAALDDSQDADQAERNLEPGANARMAPSVEAGPAGEDGLLTEDAILLEDINSTCVGGFQATFTSPSGRILDCLIGVREDGTYLILRWKSSHTWTLEDDETLWTGN